MSYGENRYKANESLGTIHAEDCAIRNLQPLPKNKKYNRINIIIIRTSKTGVLGNSKPCLHCIMRLYKNLPEKGYILNKVYYTDSNGNIQQVRLADLMDDKDKHVSMFYANRGTTMWTAQSHHCAKHCNHSKTTQKNET